MRRSSRRDKGAVSIFLVIILVPCIVITSLFADVSRLSLSKGMSYAAADLSLNTVMTEYDYDLSEFYGLMASCQSIEMFYDTAAKYYVDTMKSQGLSDEQIYVLSDYYAEAMGNKKIYDYLDVEIMGDVSVEPAGEDANLANPAVLREQVIEFMKYRAPINLATSIISVFLDNKEYITDAIGAVSAETKILNAKLVFYQRENELLQALNDVYKKIKAYDDYKISSKTIDIFQREINSYEDKYLELHTEYLYDLFDTSDLTEIRRPYYDVAFSESTDNAYPAWNKEKREDDIIQNDIKELINELNLLVEKCHEKKEKVIKTFPIYDENTYDIRYWAEFQKVTKNAIDEFTECVEKTILTYNNLENDIKNMNEENLGKYKRIKEKFIEFYLTFLHDYNDDGEIYHKFFSIIEQISTNESYKEAINAVTHKMPDGKYMLTNISKYQMNLSEFAGDFRTYSEELQSIIDDLELVKEPFAEYECALEEWNSLVTEAEGTFSKSEIVQSEREEIDKIISEGMLSLSTDENGIEVLKQRIADIKGVFDELLLYVERLKYGDVAIIDISSYYTFKKTADTILEESKVGISKPLLEEYSKESFAYEKPENADIDIAITENNNPDIEMGKISAMYEWMKERFSETTSGKENSCEHMCDGEKLCKKRYSANELYGDIVSSEYMTKQPDGSYKNKITGDIFYANYCPECISEAGVSRTGIGGEFGDVSVKGSDIFNGIENPAYPSGFNTKAVNAIDSLTGILSVFSNFTSGIASGAESVRDGLYATEYIFGMFSYDTYEYERKYQMLIDETELSDGKYISFEEIQTITNEKLIKVRKRR